MPSQSIEITTPSITFPSTQPTIPTRLTPAPLRAMQLPRFSQLMVGLLAAATLTLAACGGEPKTEQEKKKEELNKLKKERAATDAKIAVLEAEIGGEVGRVRQVVLTPVTSGTFTHYLDVQGSIKAENNVSVTPKTGGTLTRVLINEGASVSAGQVIAEIDNSLIMKGIAQVKTGLNLAKDVYERQEALWKQNIGTEVGYLQAKANYESMNDQLAQLNEQLSQTKVKSPISGTVDLVMVKVGDAVAPGVPVARVVNASQLKATAQIAESYAGRVKQGTRVKIYMPDLKREESATVQFASTSIDPSNRTFTIEANLPSRADYRPNMVAVLKIQDAQVPNAISIPVSTVSTTEEGSFVYVAETKKGKLVAGRRKIETGLTYGGNVEVTSGLTPEDRVVTVGFQDLNEGDEIQTPNDKK